MCSDYGERIKNGRLYERKRIEIHQDRILILCSFYLVGWI